MTVKDGAAHIKSLRDGREVYLDGKPVEDVTTHPAYRNAVASAARLYDFQADPANQELMTFESPTSKGTRVNRAWLKAGSYDDLVSRRKAMTAWAEQHYGFMGRSPDHVASAVTGQVIGLDVFEKHGAKFAKAYGDYHAYARDNDLFLTYVIINPQANRSKAWGEQDGEDLTLHIVDEDTTGVTVRGAKMLGTSSIMANEVFVANLQPLKPDEERFAISFAMPMATKGMKVLSRKSFEAAAVSEFDNPISTHFDENDALVYFDDVKVPWDRIFVFKNPDMCRAQFHDTPGHVYQNYQSQVRLVVKLKFMLGVARRIAETIGTISIPSVVETLGWMASEVSVVEGMLHGMESNGVQRGQYFSPRPSQLYAAQIYTQDLYPRFVHEIRELAGGSLIMLPSSEADFDNPALAKVIDKTQISSRAGETAQDRVKFLKLAWDILGSEYAGRHTQYEMFYAGARFVTCGHSFRTFGWDECNDLLESALSSYGSKRDPGKGDRAASAAAE
jgi:4-hydroxyphenylacetate 3-monooxygenase